MSRDFPVGADTVEIMGDGEQITAHCLVCDPPHLLGTWPEHVLLNQIIDVLYIHQYAVGTETT